MAPFLARSEVFERVGSTNDVVRHWLDDGVPEVCLAVAREQSAGRGRSGRTWQAPPGAGLLLSLGFRPSWLDPDRSWQLAATASLAMVDAATASAGLGPRDVLLKWPNDLVVEAAGVGMHKVGGVLGESSGLGTPDPRVIVGIGINTNWPAADFPPELAASMSSLCEARAGRPVDQAALLQTFLERLEEGVDALRHGRFDSLAWSERQITTGRSIRLERPEGIETVLALGVDPERGALVVEDPNAVDGHRHVFVGEISRVRLSTHPVASVTTGV